MAAQYLGSLTGSLVVFLTYWDSLVWYEHDRGEYRSLPDTARIFTTFPSPHLSVLGGIIDQFVGSAVFLICICAITDSRYHWIIKPSHSTHFTYHLSYLTSHLSQEHEST